MLISAHSDASDPFQTDEDDEYQPSSDSSGSDNINLKGNQLTFEIPNTFRKRVRKEKTWARNQRKLKRASGLSYRSTKGNIVSEKSFRNPICKCNNKSNEKIKVDHCKKIFENFYNLASFDLQSAYIFGQVKVIKKIRVYTESEDSRRQFTRIYEEMGQILKFARNTLNKYYRYLMVV